MCVGSCKSRALWGLCAAERVVPGEACLFPDPLALAPSLDKVVSSPGTGRACLKRKEQKGVTDVRTDLGVCVLMCLCPHPCLFCVIVLKVVR